MGTFTPAIRLVAFKTAQLLSTTVSANVDNGTYSATAGDNKRTRFKFIGFSSSGSHTIQCELRIKWLDHAGTSQLYHAIPLQTGATTVSTASPNLPVLTDIELLKLRRKLHVLGENGIQQPLTNWAGNGTAYNDNNIPEFWLGPGFAIETRVFTFSQSGNLYAHYSVLEEWS